MILFNFFKLCLFFFLAFILSLYLSEATTAKEKDITSGTTSSGVDFKDGFLKISVEKQKFQKVIDEISQKTGIKIISSDSADEDITIHFDYKPLEEALNQLFSGRSYILFYHSGKSLQSVSLSKVFILPKTEKVITAPSGESFRNVTTQPSNKTAGAEKNALEEKLAEIWGSSSLEEDVKKDFYEALKELKETKGFMEIKQLENEDFDLEKVIKDALGEI